MTRRLFAFVGLLALLLAPPVARGQTAAKGILYVLAIGVEPSLTAKGKKDIYAQDAGFVSDAVTAGKPPFGKVQNAVVSGADATRKNVLAALGKLKTQVTADDVAVVFFSCHGGWDAASGFSISVANGPNEADQWITGADLLAAVAPVKGKVVVLLDTCCAAGAMPKRAKDAPNVAFITACGKEESSLGQGESKTKPHGYFVIAACEGLKGLADADKNGGVTVGELEGYITKRATALCGEQHAVNRVTADVSGVVLTQPGVKAEAKTIYDFDGKRNPFGLADVDKPFGQDVKEFSMQTKVPGAKDDENAQAWNKREIKAKPDTLDTKWEHRWKGSGADDKWVQGSSEMKTANDRVFILCRDGSGKYLIECKRGTNDRLVGRYANLNNPDETGPFVGRLISPERLDGFWSGGRWDFRRTVADK